MRKQADPKQVEIYYEQYPPGTDVEVSFGRRGWVSGQVVARHRKGRSVNIEVDLAGGPKVYILYGVRKDIRLRFPTIHHTTEEMELIRGYEWALKVLEEWDIEGIGSNLPPAMAEQNKEAFEKAKEALHVCIVAGMDGEGE